MPDQADLLFSGSSVRDGILFLLFYYVLFVYYLVLGGDCVLYNKKISLVVLKTVQPNKKKKMEKTRHYYYGNFKNIVILISVYIATTYFRLHLNKLRLFWTKTESGTEIEIVVRKFTLTSAPI